MGTPTGTVAFLDGTTVLGMATLDASGQASFTYSGLDLGSHAITASYAGDTNFLGGTSDALTQVVSPSLTTTTTTLAADVSTSVYGQTVTFTATVAPTSGGGVPTGTVTFWDGTTRLGAAALDQGRALFSTALLGVGSHRVTAVYGGDGSFTTSTSAALAQVVSPDTATTTVASSSATSTYGDPVTFTATVTPDAPGGGTPTGLVVFLDGDSVLGYGTLDASGRATFVTAALGRGSHTVTAIYSGDGNFTGLNAVGVTQTVI
jgi:hypothetical protein